MISKLLIAGGMSKFFHLSEFGKTLEKFGIEYKLVHDVDVITGFPSRNIRNWITSDEKFNQLIEEFKPDAVFMDRQTHFGLATLKAGIPLFLHLRGEYWSEMQWARNTLYKAPHKRFALWCRDRIAKKCFNGSSIIFPICKYLEDVVKIHYPKKKTSVFYQGIDSNLWYDVEPMDLKHPCVGLLQGAVIWGKTIEMLTLEKVMDAMPEVTFYWVGEGKYRDYVLPQLKKHQNFKYIGPMQYPNKVREFLSGIDIYGLCSGIDMSPLTLQEASLMKKPVVATRVGGIPELMQDGNTGFLVEKGDHHAWTEKLTILLNDQTKTRRMGIEGRKFVTENFNWDKITRTFLEYIESYRVIIK